MFDLTEIDKSWSGVLVVNISSFSGKRFSSLDGCQGRSCDFIKPSWSNLFSRFYSEYKQRHKDEYQSDISQPYKSPGNWQVRTLYHLLARGQTDTKAQAGHHDQHCFYLSWREIRWTVLVLVSRVGLQLNHFTNTERDERRDWVMWLHYTGLQGSNKDYDSSLCLGGTRFL